MQKLLPLLFGLLLSVSLGATLPEGAEAEDFTLTDIDGITHSLYSDYLDQGWSVVIDMSATWCGPCWSFHQSGIMEDIYDDYGPSGDGILMPMMIEVDPNTNQACLYGSAGCNSSTFGDWSAGIPYPIFNPVSSVAAQINNDYDVTAYPTMYIIAPSGYVKPFVGSNTTYDDIESWGALSFQMENTTWEVNGGGCELSDIDLDPHGGYGTIQYEWSNGATTEDLYDLPDGDYYVTMTDDNDYEVEFGPITVSGFPEMYFDFEEVNEASCFGFDDGSIEVLVSGGVGSFEYEWSNGDYGPIAEDLEAGNYDLTVTDSATDCQIFESYNVFEPDVIEIEFEITDAECNEATGEIEFDNEGGTWPFTYYIDGSVYYNDAIDLPPGSYNADIEDSNGCMETASFTIGQAGAPTSMSSASGPINCTTSSVTLSGAGSSSGGGITHTWYNSSGTNVGSGMSISVSNADTYTLSVYDPSTDCSSTSNVTVAANTNVPASAANASNNLTCNVPTATISGAGSASGTGIVYQWTTPNGNISGSTTGIDISVDAAGTYNLLVTDLNNGCTSMSSATVTQSGLPSIAMNGNLAFCSGNSTNLCVTVGPTETIQWFLNGTVVSTSSCYSSSVTATYNVVLTDSNTGCSTTQSVTTTANPLPSSAFTGGSSFCAGSSTTLCYTPEQYVTKQWVINGVNMGTQTCIEVNTPGSVQLSATNNGTSCGSSTTMTIVQNNLPSATIAPPSNIDCSNSSSVLDLSTDAMNATYAWYDQAGVLIANTQDITVSQGGTYTAYVTSTAGCQSTSSVSVTADTSVPQISIDSPSMIDCNNPSSLLNLNVDSPNYTINWYNSNGMLVGSTEDITVTQAGTYTASVANSAGCETQSSVVVTADTSIPSVSIASPANLDCNTNSVILDASISNATTILWTNAAGNVIGSSEDVTVTEPGTYTVAVNNAAGCESTNTVTVTEINNSTAVADFNFTSDEFDFDFTDASTGTVTSYLWTFGDGNTSTDVNPMHTYDTPGYYTVTLETTNECGTTTTTTEVLAVGAMSTEGTHADVNCNGDNDGSATVTALGGLPGYTYLWNDAAMSTTSSISDLAPGTYTVVVTDMVGTALEHTFTIVEPEAITVTADITNTVASTSNGSIDLMISGGTGTYDVMWADGGDGTGLEPGDYTVVITDSNGCSYDGTYTVEGISSVNDIDGLTSFVVSPNPATNFMTIDASFEEVMNIQVNLVSMIGERFPVVSTSTNKVNQIVDLTAYASGVYMVELRSANQVAVKRIMITE